MQSPISVALLPISQRRIGIIGLEARETKHIGHKPLLIIVDTGNGKNVLPRVTDASDQAVGIPLKTVQDKAVSGDIPALTAKSGKISGF